MKLSQDIIFYYLQNKYHAIFFNRGISDLEVLRPVFFDLKEEMYNRIVMMDHDLDPAEIKSNILKKTLLIHFQQKTPDKLPGCSQIHIQECEKKKEVFNTLQFLFDLFEEIEKGSASLSGKEHSYHELVIAVNAILKEDIYVFDQFYNYIAYSTSPDSSCPLTPQEGQEEVVPDTAAAEIASLEYRVKKGTGRAISFSMDFGLCSIKRLCYHDQMLGTILVRFNQDKESQAKLRYTSAILELLSKYILEIYDKYQTLSLKGTSFSKLRGLLQRCLDGKSVTWVEWKNSFAETGWERAGKIMLVQFSLSLRGKKEEPDQSMIPKVETIWHNSVGFVYRKKLFLIVKCPASEIEAGSLFFRSLSNFLRENLLIAGVSRGIDNIYGIGRIYEQTEIALDMGQKTDPTAWCYRFDDYALKFLLLNCLGKYEIDPELICSQKLQILLEYDKKRTSYYKTLRVYLDSEQNASEAAKKLYIHRSTFLERMEKINKLININYSSPEEILYLQLSFRLLDRYARNKIPEDLTESADHPYM